MHFVCGTFTFQVLLLSCPIFVSSAKSFSVKFAVVLPSVTQSKLFEAIPYSLEKVLPAINYSLEKCQRYLPGADLVLNYQGTDGLPYMGPLAYLNMYLDKTADMFLGPVCMYELSQAARYSAYYRLPTLTVTGFKEDFVTKRRDDFGTLTTMTGNYLKFVDMMSAMFRQFGFKKLGMLYTHVFPPNIKCHMEISNEQCFQILKPLFAHFQKSNISTPYDTMNEPFTIDVIESMLKKRQNDSRSKYLPKEILKNKSKAKRLKENRSLRH